MTSLPRHIDVGSAEDRATVAFGPFRLDRARRLLSRDGEPVRIGSRALDILIALVDRAGDLISANELREIVWQGMAVEDAGLRVHIANLRRALGDGRDGARYVVNVTGRGYSLVAPITREDPTTAAQAPAPDSRGHVRRWPLPRLLIGREDVVRSVSELLLARRFVSIVGSGGIGKTTVATAVVEALQAEFGVDNIVFVDFGAVSDPGLVPGAVISTAGCPVGGGDPVSGLLGFIADRRMLIVFDSCEHLLDPIAVLAGRLSLDAPTVHVLVTSRESLRVQGETVYVLGPLAYPLDNSPSAAAALATPAVQLLMDRAVSSGFSGALSDVDAPQAAEICRRADGIALAIELAGSRIGAFGIRGVADLLARNVELSLEVWRNASPRHRTLEAMLDWSFNLLSGDERRVLCRLSVFVGSFTMEAALAVAADGAGRDAEVAAALANLVHKSLVWTQPGSMEGIFYRLPDTTRAYATSRLRDMEAPEPIFDRHARYYADLLETIALEHGAYAELARHAPHIGNVRRALEWSFSKEETRPQGVALAADAAPLFLGLWLLEECRRWVHLALGTRGDVSELPRREVRLLEALAVSTLHTRGNTQEVQDAIERGLNLSEEQGGGQEQLRLLAGLNLFLTRLGDFEGALAAARRCGVIASRNGTPIDRVIADWLLAAAHHLAGDQAEAVALCERGFRLEAEIGRLELNLFGYDHRLRAELALARSLWLTGSPIRASDLLLTAMEEAERSPHPGDYSVAGTHGIPILLWSGDTRRSGEHIKRLIAHTERHSLKSHAAAAWWLKGEWLLMCGEVPDGVDTLGRALKMLEREQFRMVVPAMRRALADGLARCGKHAEAQSMIRATIAMTPEMGQRFWLPELLRTQGEIMLKGPDPDIGVAETALRQSIRLAREIGATAWALKAAVPLGRLLAGQARTTEALEMLEPIVAAHADRSGTTDLMEAAELLEALRPARSGEGWAGPGGSPSQA